LELTECAINSDKNDNEDACNDTFKKVAPFMGSNTIVKDMDVLREVLGQEKLNFLAYSYGTRLGSLYSNEFPNNIRSLILDSAVSPEQTNFLQWLQDQPAGRDLIAKHRLEENETLDENITRPRKDKLEEMIEYSFNSSNQDDLENTYTINNNQLWSSIWVSQSR